MRRKSTLFPLILVSAALAVGQTNPKPKDAPVQNTPTSKSTATPEQQKELKDAFSLLQLDQIAMQNAQQNFLATDPLGQRALEVLNGVMASNPAVKEATTKADASRRATLDKVAEVRKALGLDDTWDYDFNRNVFLQLPKPAAPAKPVVAEGPKIVPAVPKKAPAAAGSPAESKPN